MKALSLIQPWATLVSLGVKRYETRSWSTKYRGPLAIHASKVVPDWASHLYWERPSPWREATEAAGIKDWSALPLGAVVAVAQLWTVLLIGDAILPTDVDWREREFGDWRAGRFAWGIPEVRALATPVPCKGHLGLWTLPPAVERAVRAQLGEGT